MDPRHSPPGIPTVKSLVDMAGGAIGWKRRRYFVATIVSHGKAYAMRCVTFSPSTWPVTDPLERSTCLVALRASIRSAVVNPEIATLLDLLGLTEHWEQRDKVSALGNLVGADESVVGMGPSCSDSLWCLSGFRIMLLRGRRCLKLLPCCERQGDFSSKPA